MMTERAEKSEYEKSLSRAKEKILPKIKKNRKAKEEREIQLKQQRPRHIENCKKLVPSIHIWVNEFIAERKADFGELGALEVCNEKMFFAEEDNRGNPLLDESGSEIISEYVIGAQLMFIPCGSVALDEDVRKHRVLSAKVTKKSINSSEPTRDEIDNSHGRRSTASLCLLITYANTFHIGANFEDTMDEKEAKGWYPHSKRVEELNYSEYRELEDLNRGFVYQQIERFLASCFSDEMTTDIVLRSN